MWMALENKFQFDRVLVDFDIGWECQELGGLSVVYVILSVLSHERNTKDAFVWFFSYFYKQALQMVCISLN